MRITLRPKAEQDDKELVALRALNSAVYPPDVVSQWPGRTIEWSPRQYSVIVWKDDGEHALAHAGVVIRHGHYNGADVKIGGIGGVMTHPTYRGQGYAAAALTRCIEFFRQQGDIDFGLLVCEQRLISLYEHLGWRVFPGSLIVMQHGQSVAFEFNRPMTHSVRQQDELSGSIDLLGPPW